MSLPLMPASHLTTRYLPPVAKVAEVGDALAAPGDDARVAAQDLARARRALGDLSSRIESAQQRLALMSGGMDLNRSPAEHQAATAQYATMALVNQAHQARRSALLSVA